MFLTLLTAAAVAQAPRYDVFLGMPTGVAQDVRMTMTTMGADVWTPSVEATSKVGSDTLVMWAWPLKGNHGIGLQIYGPDGKFRTRLEDSNIPSARAVVCNDRYVVGGGNTLRVWDAGRGYGLTAKRTFPGLSQFAALNCESGMLTTTEENRRTRVLVPSLKSANLRFGLSAATVAALNRSTMNHLDGSHTVTQTLNTPSGDTLVAWARTAGYDPKGPRSLGVQIYGPDGSFKSWLKDSDIERGLVLCGRYLVGGDNTLRVWDTAAGFKQVARKTFSTGVSGSLRELKCEGNVLTVIRSDVRLALPSLQHLR